MSKKALHGLRSLADQRYYHFVMLQEREPVTLAWLWKRFGETQQIDDSVGFTEGSFVVQHRKLRSRRSFARGAVAEALSERGEGQPPFFYDVIAGRLEFAGDHLLILGFPFAGLATDIVRMLIDDHGLLRQAKFVKADVPRLVAKMEKGLRPSNHLSVQVVGVQFVVTGDKNLTAIRIGGDDPLGAEVYRDYLKEKIVLKRISPDNCILACEKEWPVDQAASPPTLSRSRIHFDNHGNVRFYAHVGCANLRILPYAIGQLLTSDLIRPASMNPLLRLERDTAE